MSNQMLLWSSVALAWLSTVFLRQADIKRYMPAALFCSLAFIFIFETGISLRLWAVTEPSYPLVNIPAFVYGPYLLAPVWILKYTYGRFWLYLTTNIVLDYLLIFFLIDWFVRRGVWVSYISYFQILLITTTLSVFIYGYQRWQESEPVRAAVPDLQPAAGKPLDEDPADRPGK